MGAQYYNEIKGFASVNAKLTVLIYWKKGLLMLIIYPTDNWNTFALVAELTATMQMLFPKEATAFVALPVNEQEAIAINAGRWIATCRNLVYPDPLPQDFEEAQVIIMATSIGKSISDYDASSRAVIKEKAGSLEVDYDSRYKTDGTDVNPLVYRLLSPYGCSQRGGFKQVNLGRG